MGHARTHQTAEELPLTFLSLIAHSYGSPLQSERVKTKGSILIPQLTLCYYGYSSYTMYSNAGIVTFRMSAIYPIHHRSRAIHSHAAPYLPDLLIDGTALQPARRNSRLCFFILSFHRSGSRSANVGNDSGAEGSEG
jgi:hypothetical protein